MNRTLSRNSSHVCIDYMILITCEILPQRIQHYFSIYFWSFLYSKGMVATIKQIKISVVRYISDQVEETLFEPYLAYCSLSIFVKNDYTPK